MAGNPFAPFLVRVLRVARRVAALEIVILENDNPGTGTEWGAELDPV
jgi:hypothetical protein